MMTCSYLSQLRVDHTALVTLISNIKLLQCLGRVWLVKLTVFVTRVAFVIEVKGSLVFVISLDHGFCSLRNFRVYYIMANSRERVVNYINWIISRSFSVFFKIRLFLRTRGCLVLTKYLFNYFD